MAHSTARADEVAFIWCGTERDLARLEGERHRRVLAVLQIRAKCEHANAAPQTGHALLAQQQLREAVRDLEAVDERLYKVRSSRMRSQHVSGGRFLDSWEALNSDSP